MIIRSQNKLKTTTDLNLEIYDCSDDIFVIVNQTVDTLGIYSTKEKAIKVLDMICEEYQKHIKAQSTNIYFTYDPPKMFQMPQDSEV